MKDAARERSERAASVACTASSNCSLGDMLIEARGLPPVVHDNGRSDHTSDGIDRHNREGATVVRLEGSVAEHWLTSEQEGGINERRAWPAQLNLIDIGDSRDGRRNTTHRGRELGS